MVIDVTRSAPQKTRLDRYQKIGAPRLIISSFINKRRRIQCREPVLHPPWRPDAVVAAASSIAAAMAADGADGNAIVSAAAAGCTAGGSVEIVNGLCLTTNSTTNPRLARAYSSSRKASQNPVTDVFDTMLFRTCHATDGGFARITTFEIEASLSTFLLSVLHTLNVSIIILLLLLLRNG